MIINPNKKVSLRQFIELPLKLYRDDPNWVQPLVGGDISNFRAIKSPNPYISSELFLAVRDSLPVGRAALFADRLYNKTHKEKTAFFGFFECENNPHTAAELLDAVENSARRKGMNRIVGPVDYSTNYQAGLLVDGFSRPTVMTPYNMKYYRQLIEEAGYRKAIDLYSYMFTKDTPIPDRAYRIEEIVQKKRPGLCVVPLKSVPGTKKASLLTKIYNEAFSALWGFVPMTVREFSSLVRTLSHLDHSDLNYIAFMGRTPVGILLTVPDLYSGKRNPVEYVSPHFEAAKEKEHFRRLRLTVLGVIPDFRGKGIETMMGLQVIRDSLKRGYEEIEFSVILENNTASNNLINREFGLPIDRTFRIYEKQL